MTLIYIFVSLSIVFAYWLPLWTGLTQYRKMKTYGKTREEAEEYLVRLERSHKLMPRYMAIVCGVIIGTILIPTLLPLFPVIRNAGLSPFFWGFVIFGYASIALMIYGIWLVSKLRIQWLKQRIAGFDAPAAA